MIPVNCGNKAKTDIAEKLMPFTFLQVFNRPGVAGAVLQPPL